MVVVFVDVVSFCAVAVELTGGGTSGVLRFVNFDFFSIIKD